MQQTITLESGGFLRYSTLPETKLEIENCRIGIGTTRPSGPVSGGVREIVTLTASGEIVFAEDITEAEYRQALRNVIEVFVVRT